jgi:hypothetical protein
MQNYCNKMQGMRMGGTAIWDTNPTNGFEMPAES